MRAFIALDLPDGVSSALMRVQEALPFGRPVDADQFHLTLAFLGDRPDAEIEAAHEALETLHFPAFEAQLQGLGTFGGADGRALWAGLRDASAVTELATRVRSRLHGAGLPLERRRFRPHVTIARLGPDDARDTDRLARFLSVWSSFPSPAFDVSELVLYKSTLTRSGAMHEALAHYLLDGGTSAAFGEW